MSRKTTITSIFRNYISEILNFLESLHSGNRLRHLSLLSEKFVPFCTFLKIQIWVPFCQGFPPDVVAVHKCGRWKASDFRLFEVTLRDDIHDNMHCRIGGSGGTMCTKEAANAPEFFLHHGFTDKIWGDWQKTGPEYRNAHWKGRLNPSLLGTGYRVRDLLDLAHQPG